MRARSTRHRLHQILGLLALTLCGCYRGTAKPTTAAALAADREWVLLQDVPIILQVGERDCGAAAVAMVLGHWGIPADQAAIRSASALPDDQALSAGFLRTYLRGAGLQTYLIAGTLLDLERELRAGRPVLVGVVKQYATSSYAHYQVVTGFNRTGRELAVIDPAVGWRVYSFEGFAQEWGKAALTLVATQRLK